MAENTPKAESSKTKNILLGLGIIAVLAVVVIVGVYGTGKPITTTSVVSSIPSTSVSTTAATTSVSTTSTTVPAGIPKRHEIIVGYGTSSFLLAAGQTRTINFTVPSGAYAGELNGTYRSTGSVEVATLTPTEYSAFASNASSITSMANYYGSGSTGAVSTSLVPGGYSLVFHNPSSSEQDNVTISRTILLVYTTYG